MPITLVVRSGDGSPSLTFDGPRVVLGRGSGCDVRLPDPSVSHRHASIRVNAGEHALIDEGSSNGTFVGGVRLAPHAPRVLKSGDLVRVGRVWLEVRIDQRPATRDLGAVTRDLALALVADAMRALGSDTVTKVHVVEGPDAGAVLSLEEEGRAYRVGRGETCDLLLADKDASREHAQIVRRGGSTLLRDLGSKNGVLLGDAPILPDRDVTWRSQLMVRIGATVLALEEPVANALAELEAGPDEAMGADEVPPPPPASTAPTDSTSSEASASRKSAPDGPSSQGVPPSVAPVGAAPIARVDEATTPPVAPRKKKSAWSPTDVTVVVAAVLVIGASIAGLVWLLRG